MINGAAAKTEGEEGKGQSQSASTTIDEMATITRKINLQSTEHNPPSKPIVLLYPTTKLNGFLHFSLEK
jgi:hypothetical protein